MMWLASIGNFSTAIGLPFCCCQFENKDGEYLISGKATPEGKIGAVDSAASGH
jgi:hypothetical protein